ncbi:tetratricopeptide repeat protein [Tenacibaculum sp. nBUS_03]|uniref:tetratricopeptide repeat protein n=1 Tax=Tenacibaculum sp. nBUS_03 TaxID=3395320 RepID=UPI003EB7C63B
MIKLLLLFAYIFLLQETTSQHNYKNIVARDKYKKIKEEEVDSLLKSVIVKDSSYAQIAHAYSYFFHKKKKNYKLAIKYALIEIKTLEDLNLNSKEYTNALYNIGNFYYISLQYNMAIEYYNKAIKSNAFPKKVAQSYCQIAKYQRIKGDFYMSLQYYFKGLPLLEKFGSKKSIILHYLSLSNTCNKLNTKKSSDINFYYLKKADSILTKLPKSKIKNKIRFDLNNYFAILNTNKYKYNFQKAKSYYLKNLNESFKTGIVRNIAISNLNLGELYLKEKKDSCLYFLKKSLEYDSFNKLYIHDTYKNIASFYIYKKDFSSALKNIQKSINYNFKVKENKLIKHLTNNKILNTLDKNTIRNSLKIKTEILIQLYNTTQNKEYLQKAIDNVQLTNKIVNILINYSTEANTKYLWRKEISETFNLGIYTAYLLNDSKLMFELMEKNKAFLLTLNINENIKLTNLPDEISTKNNIFKKDIFQLESETDTHKASKKKDSLFDLKVSYQNFKDSIQKIYPQFSNQNNDIQQVSLSKVKSNLRKNDIKLYYSLNTSNVDTNKQSMLGLLIANNKDIRFKIKNIDSVLLGITEYKKLISKPLTQKQELARFKKVSYSLYNQLFPTKEIKDLIKNKNISIVSDVFLENIPFEAFNTSATELRYLVNDCNISYSYSSSFSEFNKNRESKNKYRPCCFCSC